MIKVFCNQKEKDLKNFWGHIVFHPTNAIEDDWGKAYLDKIAEDGAAKTVRIYSMFEEIVTLDENGEMQFDFSKNDYRIDYLLSKGFDLMIVYAFIPPWLSAEQDDKLIKPRYKNVYFHKSYASDYSKWEEICRVYTQHLVDRYGEDTVAKWPIHCYNEPDLTAFFYQNAPSYVERAEEYCKLYDGFEAGVTSVSKKIRIGGCGLSEGPTHFEFLEHFLRYVKKTGKKFDFLSYHSYGTFYTQANAGLRPLNAYDSYTNTLTVKKIADMCGFKDIPFICDEWGGATDGYFGMDKCPMFEFRENELYSAYYAKLLTYYDESVIDQELLMICLSGQHDLTEDLMGHRNFFSKSFYPKPIFNAHVLANKLGDEKLCHYVDLQEERVSIMPSRHASDGHISVLLCYADPTFAVNLPEKTFDTVFEGLDKEYKVVKYVIDKTHANCYTKFCELGKPQDASEEIKEEIRRAGALVAEDAGTVSPENNVLTLTMENNAVVLLELMPM